MDAKPSAKARNHIKRNAKRAVYNEEQINEILDSGFICHVGFVHEGQTYVIPTGYGRIGKTLYMHGAVGNRMLKSMENSHSTCVTVTFMDGLVLARSLFHHSVNYRSVVMFGTGRKVEDPEELILGLKAMSDQMMPGRWEEARYPNEKELKATSLIAFDIAEASAKVRAEGPNDDPEDEDPAVWSGLVPLRQVAEMPVKDHITAQGVPVPPSVIRYVKENP